MTKLDITKAKINLFQLLDMAINGQEIVITQDNHLVAKIVPIQPKRPLKFGSAKGQVWMSEVFDEPLEFKEYME